MEEQPKYYNEATKKAVYRYRQANKDLCNAISRRYYYKKMEDPEWRAERLRRCNEANKRQRDKRRGDNPPKKAGRPRKPVPVIIIENILSGN